MKKVETKGQVQVSTQVGPAKGQQSKRQRSNALEQQTIFAPLSVIRNETLSCSLISKQ